MKFQSLDRLIIHQFDAATPSPGGIDTCIRGLIRSAPPGLSIGVVGVAVDGGEKRVGKWERHAIDSTEFEFLPVASLDPGDQGRRLPHSGLVAAGLLRHRRKIGRVGAVQAHRADLGLVAQVAFRNARHVYSIHTQAGGLNRGSTDSFWVRAASIHEWIEKRVVAGADRTVVFNENYASELARSGAEARFLPTWFDSRRYFVETRSPASSSVDMVWVGRLEEPKDPALALDAGLALARRSPETAYTLTIVGSGTLLALLKDRLARNHTPHNLRIRMAGRQRPEEAARIVRAASVLLMTSFPGYEGFPRVLVEGLACGLPAAVTFGSDTGGLVQEGVTGSVAVGRSPDALADAVARAVVLDDRKSVASAVSHLSEDAIVGEFFEYTS